MSGPLPHVQNLLHGYQKEKLSEAVSPMSQSERSMNKRDQINEKCDIKIKKQSKEKQTKAQFEKKLKEEIASGISQYPELQIKPVNITTDDVEYKHYNRKDKKLFTIQACLFGRDLLTNQMERFKDAFEHEKMGRQTVYQ